MKLQVDLKSVYEGQKESLQSLYDVNSYVEFLQRVVEFSGENTKEGVKKYLEDDLDRYLSTSEDYMTGLFDNLLLRLMLVRIFRKRNIN